MIQRSLLMLPILLALSSISAQAAPWYRVEVMLIAYQDEALMGQEQWSPFLEPPLPESRQPDFQWWHFPQVSAYNALFSGFGFAATPAAGWALPLQPLPTLLLQEEAERISKRKDMQIIWHQAWVEPVQEQEAAIRHTLDLHIADRLDLHLSGSFSLYRSRFLHLTTDLVMQHSTPTAHPDSHEEPVIPADPRAVAAEPGPDLLLLSNLDGALQPQHASAVPLRAAHIRQSRRMRSGELHYIDHPLLGIVVKVVPVTDAASL